MNVLKGTSGIVLDSDGKALVNGNGTVALPDGVGVLDLGTLTWTRAQISSNYWFYVNVTSLMPKLKGNAIDGKHIWQVNTSFTYINLAAFIGNTQTNPVLYIRNDQYTTAEDFKSAMNGTMLFYEKYIS